MNKDKKAKEKGDDPADLLDIKLGKHKESAAKDIKKESDDAEQSTAEAANRQTG